MSFKLIIATGFYAASMFPQISGHPPMTGSLRAADKYETEQLCAAAAIAMNKDFKRDMETADKAVRDAREPPFAAVMARRKAKDMDRLTTKDWDEIRDERKKIVDAMPPIPLSIAFCIDTDFLR